MTPSGSLDVHPAAPEEIAAAHRNVFDIWSKGLPLDEHVQYRLNSPSHSRATWYVGTLDRRVVVSLGCYPVAFHWERRTVPGIAIGSIYTVKDCRGRGFAPRLLAFVEQDQQARGAELSVLYSDIDPNYYAQLGYQLCPSWQGSALEMLICDVQDRLVEIDAREHLPWLMSTYAGYHGSLPLSFARDESYWQAMLKKFADDRFFLFQDSSGQPLGYVRVGVKSNAWRITDFALLDQSPELLARMYSAFLEQAAGADATVNGWLPDTPTTREYFALSPRPTEITMFKPLVARPLTPAAIAGTTYFCEIDHV